MTVELGVRTMTEWVDKRIAPAKPFRAIVTSVSGGLVGIRRPEAASAGTALHARVAGFDLAIGDEVLCVNLGKFPVIIGKIQRATPTSLSVPALDNVVTARSSHSGSDTATNASTTVYQTSITLNIVLPAGTWLIEAVGGTAFLHSASGSADYRVTIDGNTGASQTTPNLSTTVYSPWVDSGSVGSLAGGRTVVVLYEYKANAAGTVTASNPWLWVTATRTA